MKNKDASASSTAACCDDPNCCCKGGDSCPMKMGGEASQTMSTDVKYESATADTAKAVAARAAQVRKTLVRNL